MYFNPKLFGFRKMTRKSVIVKGKAKKRVRKRCSDLYKTSNPAYWEGRLKRMGLTEDAGRANWIDYGHSVLSLDWDGRIAYRVDNSGESLERGEWPVSLS